MARIPFGTPSAPPTDEALRQLAVASLAANLRKAHPHESDQASNPGAPTASSRSVPPGNGFTQGVPGHDIEQTALYSIGSITGEVGGFDIFNAVNPADAEPGKGLVTAFYASQNPRRTDTPGDRSLLGDARTAYYLGRTAAIDNDFARMLQVDTRPGNEVVLHGQADDYRMVEVSGDERGTAIFYNHRGNWDLIGFFDLILRTDSRDPIYRYATAFNTPSATPKLARQWDQFGGRGADLITGIEVDAAGNVYAVGFTRSDLRGIFPATTGRGQLFLAKWSASGERQWLPQFGSQDGVGDMVWDMVVDATSVYVVARYIAPDNEPVGIKDAAYFRFDSRTGAAAANAEWKDQGVQFPGTIALDNSDFVYVTGIGHDRAQLNPDGSQDPYIEKSRRSDLSLVKRKMFGGDEDNVPGAGGANNKEPWGGLAFVPSAGGAPGEGTVYTTGWTAGAYEGTVPRGSADAFFGRFRSQPRHSAV